MLKKKNYWSPSGWGDAWEAGLNHGRQGQLVPTFPFPPFDRQDREKHIVGLPEAKICRAVACCESLFTLSRCRCREVKKLLSALPLAGYWLAASGTDWLTSFDSPLFWLFCSQPGSLWIDSFFFVSSPIAGYWLTASGTESLAALTHCPFDSFDSSLHGLLAGPLLLSEDPLSCHQLLWFNKRSHQKVYKDNQMFRYTVYEYTQTVFYPDLEVLF